MFRKQVQLRWCIVTGPLAGLYEAADPFVKQDDEHGEDEEEEIM